MNNSLYAEVQGQVQFGPVYHCFVCGEKVGRLIPYVEHRIGVTFLDRFAEHLAYLDLAPPCKNRRHPARVVVVGPAITPVDLDIPRDERHSRIEEAIGLLTEKLAERDDEGSFSPEMSLAMRLYAHAITPAQAVEEMQTLIQRYTFAIPSPAFIDQTI
jgi:hypothetical protein